jgi:hypothetical protein
MVLNFSPLVHAFWNACSLEGQGDRQRPRFTRNRRWESVSVAPIF